jgi:uracil-DNA glycosylase family 4
MTKDKRRKRNEPGLDRILAQVRACTNCAACLPFDPKPVVHLGPDARLMIIGQAPGTRVHRTGIPWNDPSGDNLRAWMGLTREEFYDQNRIAIMPMGFCYPGKGKSGDLPPRPECAPLWHDKIRAHLPNIGLTLLIGQYAHAYYLAEKRKKTLTETVRAWREYLPLGYLPLVHPSPRNRLWQKRNPWFEKDVVPAMRQEVSKILKTHGNH